jgi:predicted Zn-dependent protease
MPRRIVALFMFGTLLSACLDECAPVSRPLIAPAEGQQSNVDLGYKAPVITEFVLVPMGSSPIVETKGLADVLSQRFPGLKLRLEPQQHLPDGVLNEQGQVVAERIFAKLPPRPGTIAIVGRDLTVSGATFVYGSMDPATANGVVSVSRFRSPRGAAVPEDAVLIDLERALATVRLQNQVTSTLAKIFGMSFPCSHRKCVLRFPRMISELDDKRGEFCPAHAAELARIMAARADAGVH